jgi:hypothetical protein
VTFADTLRSLAAERGIALSPSHPEPLAGLDYALERELKVAALAAFWRQHRLPGTLSPLVAAPLPRGYRTTSKRRVVEVGGNPLLTFPGLPQRVAGAAAPSALDRPEHQAVYDFLAPRLARPGARPLARVLTHVVVRGKGEQLAVLFDLRELSAPVVRVAKRLGEEMAAAELGVAAASLYLDPTGSDYYLEARRPAGLGEKQLFGPSHLEVEVDGVRLRHDVTSFSQVNPELLPALVAAVGRWLAPLSGHTLLDLYCGYGLFALTVGRQAARVVGIDWDGPAIESARGNARHQAVRRRGPGADAGRAAGPAAGSAAARFLAGEVTATLLQTRLDPPRGGELVVLDPPRQGTAPGVIATLAARQPERVVELCCGIDVVPQEVAAWVAAGRRVRGVVPFDLFAGTAALELLVAL